MEGTDDKADWQEVLEAMKIMKMSEDEQFDIMGITAAVLHIGNISFGIETTF